MGKLGDIIQRPGETLDRFNKRAARLWGERCVRQLRHSNYNTAIWLAEQAAHYGRLSLLKDSV